MPTVNDLALPHLPIGEQSFADDPDRYMIAARKQHDWLATSDFGIVVTDYDAATQMLLDFLNKVVGQRFHAQDRQDVLRRGIAVEQVAVRIYLGQPLE